MRRAIRDPMSLASAACAAQVRAGSGKGADFDGIVAVPRGHRDSLSQGWVTCLPEATNSPALDGFPARDPSLECARAGQELSASRSRVAALR
jgi:hypothetical protein